VTYLPPFPEPRNLSNLTKVEHMRVLTEQFNNLSQFNQNLKLIFKEP